MNKSLNEREQSILNVIKENIREKGYPPSVREIGQSVGLSSSSTVHGYLKKLEQKGYIRRDPTKPRAIEILEEQKYNRTAGDDDLVDVPLLGQVAAGNPLLAVENCEDILSLPRSFTGYGELFMLKIRGDSMIEAGILEGDLVLVRRQPNATDGEIVVALLDGEATVKRFFKEKNHIRLQPENPNMAPILVRDVQILGKVVGLLRSIK
ncbi:repressor LexA [Desulfohalotomaculum tongense]|uniref:transcriptional repressor LexA n=1 Tax=Desulforadius tongensis TaxID=1216062 RepID=UPI00195DF58E|nr:transcriptional repressor LexA [Desulforadius tongensis]MBM7854131.1 repressor LexA [Desulforadius tongensis]